MAARHPGNTDYQRKVATIRNNVGQAYLGLGKLQEAEVALRESIDVMTLLSRATPARAEDLEHLGRSYRNLNRVFVRLGNVKQAITAARQSLGVFEEAARRHPNGPRYQVELAYAHLELGLTLANLQNVEQQANSLDAYEQARKLLEPPRSTS